jgi:hypothetical protein
MSVPSIAPIKQAVVKALRDSSALKAGVNNEFHEGLSPRDIDYPYCIYEVVWAVRSYDSTSNMIRAGVEVWIVSDDQVQAQNLDALVIGALQDKSLSFGTSGLTERYCRRVSDTSTAGVDDAGRKVYQIGGTHEIWADAVT